MKLQVCPALALGLSVITCSSFSALPVIKNTPQLSSAAAHKQANLSDKDGVSAANKWFIGLGIAKLFPFATNASNFAFSGIPGFPDDHYVGDGVSDTEQYSIFAGYQWRQNSNWLPAYSLGLQYSYTSAMTVNGFVFINDLPDAKNFTYTYDISQHVPTVRLKVDLYRWQQFMPYVAAGAGLAINRVRNYSDSPIPGATLMQRRYGFTSSQHTQFAGSIGAGLDFALSDKGQISVGYELSYYGKARTGLGQDVLGANRLVNKLNANAVVVQGTYFCD